MLQGNFFSIKSIETAGVEINAVLEINALHEIFEGHFPGQPVVPGVCMMQMIKELLESATTQSFNISKASEMKFLAVIDPTHNNRVEANVKYTVHESGHMMVVASLFSEELTYFKFKGLLAPC
jgi:3-hydroxyacyl-[acyl-carrier-protein] dehydratase